MGTLEEFVTVLSPCGPDNLRFLGVVSFFLTGLPSVSGAGDLPLGFSFFFVPLFFFVGSTFCFSGVSVGSVTGDDFTAFLDLGLFFSGSCFSGVSSNSSGSAGFFFLPFTFFSGVVTGVW